MAAVPKFSPALAPLWQAVHDRLSSGRPVSRVRLGPLTVEQREALADLLGLRRLPDERPVVSLAALDEALGSSVRQVVTQLVGPVGDRAADRQRAAEERAGMWDWFATHPVVRAQPALVDWVAAVRRGGLIGGSAGRTRDELGRALRVLGELPAAGLPLPVFADRVLGDPHALDEDTRCAGLVARALSTIFDVTAPADAPGRRALWERAGVADDELSSTVLVAGLRPAGDDAVDQILRLCAEHVQAAALTLRQLRGGALADSAPETVWVVENPSVLALALARFGPDCPPMACTAGWPSSAGTLLLQRLGSAGATLRYHGDFDGEGLRIAANIVARTGARPWRMTSADYLAAVGDGPPVGRVTPVPWDADLAEHLIRVGTAVPEERVAAALLDEIARRRGD
ncbi:MAG: TIGR02679 family protein [Pseudonocardiaceae bacterium]